MESDVERLQREIDQMREAFWAWESIELAAQTDPEEQLDAERLWEELTLAMMTPPARAKETERREQRGRRNAATSTS